jgi:hypothetical protein
MTTTRRDVLTAALTAEGASVTPDLADAQERDRDHDHEVVPSRGYGRWSTIFSGGVTFKARRTGRVH